MSGPVEDVPYDRAATSPAGELVQISPYVRRIVAPNPGPFTFTGTCTYVVGRGLVAVIDPGPDDPAHVAALLAGLAGETVTHILVTHTHRDHSPAARSLKAATGAPILGCAPHRPARERAAGEIAMLDAANDLLHQPDVILDDDAVVSGAGFTLTAIATPGHTMNHLAFALKEENALFSGDHVMAWSTTIVAPPDGAMRPYIASLEKLRARGEAIYWPGHGGPVTDPVRFVKALLAHRRQRETSILALLATGPMRIEAIVARIYETLDPRLRGAAALSVFAHLEDLVEQGRAKTQEAPSLTGLYWAN